MRTIFRSRGHSPGLRRWPRLIRSASCQATASLDVSPRRIAREASLTHCLIIVNTMALLVSDFPPNLRVNSYATNGV